MSAQAQRALAHGNQIRLAGHGIRREIAALDRKAGMIRVAELLEDPPLPVQRMQIDYLVLAIHRVGKHETYKLLRSLDINSTWYVGPDVNGHKSKHPLASTQRQRLATHLRNLGHPPGAKQPPASGGSESPRRTPARAASSKVAA